jgi:hypothetical protein
MLCPEDFTGSTLRVQDLWKIKKVFKRFFTNFICFWNIFLYFNPDFFNRGVKL